MTSVRKKASPVHRLVGERIRKARDEVEWTQVQMAERLGARRSYVSSIELGTQGLSLRELVRWALLLDCDPGSLLPTLNELKKIEGVVV